MQHQAVKCHLHGQHNQEKVKAITGMPASTDIGGLKRFLSLKQYVSKFIQKLSDIDELLRCLLKDGVDFRWEYEQDSSFQQLKHLCSMPPELTYYDVNKPVEIDCHSSKYDLGAVRIQESRIVAYASSSLADTETPYAKIEKEMLSVVFSTTRFHRYIFGKDKVVEYNNHKPLENIYKKPLLSAPEHLQNMLLRLQWYDTELRYRKGKQYLSQMPFIPCKIRELNDTDIEDHICMIAVDKLN